MIIMRRSKKNVPYILSECMGVKENLANVSRGIPVNGLCKTVRVKSDLRKGQGTSLGVEPLISSLNIYFPKLVISLR